jgi:hypothetical protein
MSLRRGEADLRDSEKQWREFSGQYTWEIRKVRKDGSVLGEETDGSRLPYRGTGDQATRSRPLGNHTILRQRETAAGLLNPTLGPASRRHH